MSERIPPLNLTKTELELARALIQPEAYDTASWPDADVEALHSLNEKLDGIHHPVERGAELPEEVIGR